MTEGIVIRPAVREDLPRLLALLLELRGEPGDAAAAAGVWEAILAAPRRTVLVAEERDELVGTADLMVVPNLTHAGAPWRSASNASPRGSGSTSSRPRAMCLSPLRRFP